MREQPAPDRVRDQYEAHPYPAREPRDEAKRLITGSPSHFDELNHYLFAGKLLGQLQGRLQTRAEPFRVLVAGGGTGDGLIMLAQQARDRGVAAAIAYVDLSRAARRIAEARAAARRLDGIAFHTGSLLDLARIAPGPFDYIDCCGVLHHLADPAAGLRALAERLAPGGGMGLMLYGAYGRTGVYPLQSALRRLAGTLPDADRLALARRLVEGLPETNWFRRNPFLADHRASDAGLYDLLLHSRDRAFTVPEIADLVEAAGLGIVAFIDPAAYDPGRWLDDPKLRARLDGLDPLARAALAEELSGALKTHILYVRRLGEATSEAAEVWAASSIARPDDPAVRPVLRGLDGPALARQLKPGQPLTIELRGRKHRLALPPLAPAMLARIDGERSLADLHKELAALQPAGLAWDAFKAQFDALFVPLNAFGKLFLRA